MKKISLFILAVLFITKANAQCSVATQSLSENFTAVPPCWFGIGTSISGGIFELSPGLSGQETMILPKTINAKGILEFDVINITNSNPTITLLIGAVSSQTSTAMSSFQIIKYQDVPAAISGSSIVYAHYTVDLSNYVGSYQYIALSLVGGTMNPTLRFDNFTYNSACISTSVTAAAQNYAVQLNKSGLAYVTPTNINNGSTSSCGTPNLSLNQTSFSCSNIGINTVTLTAVDSGNNIATTTASVTVLPAINDEAVTVLQNAVCLGKSTTVTTGSSVLGIKYYLRDDATNATVAGPITGNGSPLSFNTGTLTSNTTFNVYAETQSGVNNALDFDGTNDVITTSLSTTATNSLTLEAWIFPRATTYKRIISCYTNDLTTSGEFLIDTYNATNNGRGLRFAVEGDNNSLHQLSAANVLTLNAWNHVAGTFNNGVTTLYVNGNSVATSTASFTSIPKCTNKITIGEDPIIIPSILVYFNGKMDDIRIWNTARTQTEIAGNMNNCLIGNEIGLTNYFKISENGGSTVADIKTNSIGTMSGMTPATAWVAGNVNCVNTNCNLEMTNLITVGIAPNPTITVNSGTICAGTSFTITPGGANTYTIQSGSAIKTPTSNASYTVVGTSSLGCVSNTFATSSIAVNTLPIINATTSNTLLCVGQTASLTANGATSYTWNTSSTNTVIVISPTVTTSYTVTGTNDNGCENTSTITQNVSTCTDITQLTTLNNELTIFPNPVLNELTIQIDAKIEKITIYNLLGTIVQSEVNSSFSVANLNAGVYVIEVISNHNSVIKRFIKE